MVCGIIGWIELTDTVKSDNYRRCLEKSALVLILIRDAVSVSLHREENCIRSVARSYALVNERRISDVQCVGREIHWIRDDERIQSAFPSDHKFLEFTEISVGDRVIDDIEVPRWV